MSDNDIFILAPTRSEELVCRRRDDHEQDAADIRLVLRALEWVAEAEARFYDSQRRGERAVMASIVGHEQEADLFAAYTRLRARYGEDGAEG